MLKWKIVSQAELTEWERELFSPVLAGSLGFALRWETGNPFWNAMQRYHFNVHDGTTTLDREGTLLSDLPAAKRSAVKLAGDLLKEQQEEFWDGGAWRVEIADERGHILCAVHFHGANAPEKKTQLHSIEVDD